MNIAIETEGSNQKKNYLIMQEPKEYKKLFKEIPENLFVNFNLYLFFASSCFKFLINNFIKFLNKHYCY